MSENILEINNLSKYFGGLAAVSDCSLNVKRGTITGIIGPNGSGKTTLFVCTSGGSDMQSCIEKKEGRIESFQVDIPGAGIP